MSKAVFKRGPEAGLSSLPIEDGSIIITKDKLNMYADIAGNRVAVKKNATDDDIVAMFNGATPMNGNDVSDVDVEEF